MVLLNALPRRGLVRVCLCPASLAGCERFVEFLGPLGKSRRTPLPYKGVIGRIKCRRNDGCLGIGNKPTHHTGAESAAHRAPGATCLKRGHHGGPNPVASRGRTRCCCTQKSRCGGKDAGIKKLLGGLVTRTTLFPATCLHTRGHSTQRADFWSRLQKLTVDLKPTALFRPLGSHTSPTPCHGRPFADLHSSNS